MKNATQYQYWLNAFLMSLIIFLICGLELSVRRNWDVNFYLTNKVLASTAFIMIALSFSLSAFKELWGV